MFPLLFAVAVLAQVAPPLPQEGPPARLQFHATLPADLPDPKSWPGNDVGIEDLVVSPRARAAPYLQSKGVCKAAAPCVLEGRFEHSVTTDLSEHVDRYILIGPAGRLEGYTYQRGREGTPRYFVLTSAVWEEIHPEDEEYQYQVDIYSNLSNLLYDLLLSQR